MSARTRASASPGLADPPCDLCGGSGEEVVAAAADVWRHVACAACGLVWVAPRPADVPGLNASIYGGPSLHGVAQAVAQGPSSAGRPAEAGRAPGRLLRELEALVGPPAGPRGGAARRALDVGCGAGAFLVAARARGWDVVGVELDPARAAEAAARGAGPVHAGDLAGLPAAAGAFDLVRLHHVVEHVASPRALLAAAAARLAPGGVLAVDTPNAASWAAARAGARWRHLGRPGNGHLVLLSPRAVRAHAAGLGLEVVRLATRGARAWSPGRRGPLRLAARLAEQAVEPWARLAGRGAVLEALLRRPAAPASGGQG